jgi:thiol-disulfide isomerase/thioredoxin
LRIKCIFAACLFILSSQNLHAQDTLFTSLSGDEIKFNASAPEATSLLIVWASWCRYCMAEIPTLKQAHAKYSGVRFIGVNVNKNPDDGRAIETQRELPYPSISDPNLEFSDQFKVKGTPDFILIDRSGQIIARSQRFDEGFIATLEQHVQLQ